MAYVEDWGEFIAAFLFMFGFSWLVRRLLCATGCFVRSGMGMCTSEEGGSRGTRRG